MARCFELFWFSYAAVVSAGLMPTNTRRNSSVICNGIATNKLESWRRSFRQNKRTSMLDMNVLSKSPPIDQNDHAPPQKFIYPLEDAGCSYTYSNLLINIGNYEFMDSEAHNIGHGAYGDVFKGKAFDVDRRSYRPVAVKRINETNVKCHELEAMKRLNNPFLVSLIDISHDENHLNAYIIMELCDTDLDKYLAHSKEGFLTPSECTLVTRDLACGYYALFKEHVVHRDIKPQNVLLILASNGSIQLAKVTDFGVSRVLEDSDGKLSNIAGTFAYMAPEIGANVLKPFEYGCMVDIWSIGCVLYQCTTGRVPFTEQDLCRIFLHCACNNSSAYDLDLEFPADTPENYAAMIRGLLEPDWKRRTTPEQLYAFALKNIHVKNDV